MVKSETIAHDKLNVGLEIHQQLGSKNKLFCDCKINDSNEYDFTFKRNLRPTQSEMGSYDQAALFESKKIKTVKYQSSKNANCLIESDEEPPKMVNNEALEFVLTISLALNCTIEDELHVMRKIVIDGSNTTGFQRTILVGRNGFLEVEGVRVGIQSVCLEEDAARIINEDKREDENKGYSLDRLGIPLIEIALEPISDSPIFVTNVAQTIGRLLRSTKKVTRGLGSIRQDVNISTEDGPVVEVKGVQQLSQLPLVIEYERKRQDALNQIANELKKRKIDESSFIDHVTDVTQLLSKSSSKVVKKILTGDTRFTAFVLRGFKGLLSFEPYPAIRLGKELGDLVKVYGIGGIFHSDELPNYGITPEDVESISAVLRMDKNDAFVLIGGPTKLVNTVLFELFTRIKKAFSGVVPETRSARLDGVTVFSRPKPGASRMYPETDIPYISIDKRKLKQLSQDTPQPWNEIIDQICKKYNINKTLAENIFDSKYFPLFEKIVSHTSISPSFVISKLTEDLVSMEREGYDSSILSEDVLFCLFTELDNSRITKESIPLVIEKLLKNESMDVDEIISSFGTESISEEYVDETISKIIHENATVISQKGLDSVGLLMGRCMEVLRGKIDGEKVNKKLIAKLTEYLQKSKG
ncbi:MAG: Glu-tRNA(Gln) amidotransferase subunit GatE [Nitrososphaeraceae archaeon]|nr:Glu-tRNA(Gln) amidotransferase subunit GatE [Nitrososphaeraceae archaeon]MDW0233687.1 Glu-tRNA(Gln) amidotransferase subunit GatE [Nitrososphaeraceae archaeon]MDW0273934.1 Glu-tRNA(Gln) amidotransferase subunit GatE [Nitrososphaeraceae archaeon]MDW0339680.1 Glu-tRNA(Gln) amidotransferase subunit GatE [Nitrososphaeraceae archaeon]